MNTPQEEREAVLAYLDSQKQVLETAAAQFLRDGKMAEWAGAMSGAATLSLTTAAIERGDHISSKKG
ncbi:hypothetical protein M2336_001679 [Sphingobium sp. B1D7B]|uniref:hypothetical protein n=1 Tax=Sphingobium sp. B1D7B TaxID=2940578 RepID=UPI0022248D4F|nr:hypothetical protein [Sphingobium sp. B1D7B]MCW2405050.1 hypothetical protein [Sphingobium sp. B1D7B]